MEKKKAKEKLVQKTVQLKEGFKNPSYGICPLGAQGGTPPPKHIADGIFSKNQLKKINPPCLLADGIHKNFSQKQHFCPKTPILSLYLTTTTK